MIPHLRFPSCNLDNKEAASFQLRYRECSKPNNDNDNDMMMMIMVSNGLFLQPRLLECDVFMLKNLMFLSVF